MYTPSSSHVCPRNKSNDGRYHHKGCNNDQYNILRRKAVNCGTIDANVRFFADAKSLVGSVGGALAGRAVTIWGANVGDPGTNRCGILSCFNGKNPSFVSFKSVVARITEMNDGDYITVRLVASFDDVVIFRREEANTTIDRNDGGSEGQRLEGHPKRICVD